MRRFSGSRHLGWWTAGLSMWVLLGLGAACGEAKDGRVAIELLLGCRPTAEEVYQTVDLYCLSVEDDQGRLLAGPNCSTSLTGVDLKLSETDDLVTILVEGFEQLDNGRHVEVVRGRSAPASLISGEKVTVSVPIAPVGHFGLLAAADQGCQPLPFPVARHSATVFPSGHLLIVGSERGELNSQRAALLMDPYTHEVQILTTPDSLHRNMHRASLLDDGRLLIAGGSLNSGQAATKLVVARGGQDLMGSYSDTLSRSWDLSFEELARDLVHPRSRLTAAVFYGDRVLLADGDNPPEMFLGQTETSDLMQVNGVQAFPLNGRLMSVVPYSSKQALTTGAIQDRVGLLDVADGDRSANYQGFSANVGTRDGALGIDLGDERVMFLGYLSGAATGASAVVVLSANHLAEPQGLFSVPVPADFPVRGFSATLLSDGRVYVAGGVRVSGQAASAFFIVPEGAGNRWLVEGAPAPLLARQDHSASLLPDGRLLIVGGNPVGDALDPALSMEVIAF